MLLLIGCGPEAPDAVENADSSGPEVCWVEYVADDLWYEQWTDDLLTRVEVSATDGTPLAVWTNAWDDHGRLDWYELDDDVDGVFESVTDWESSYDEDRVTLTQWDHGDDGAWDARIAYSYDEEERLSEIIDEYDRVYTYTYDDDGLHWTIERTDQGERARFEWYTTDDLGRIIVADIDVWGDGDIDEYRTFTWVDGRLVHAETAHEVEDTTPDEYDWEYDADGRVVRYTESNSGKVEAEIVYTWSCEG